MPPFQPKARVPVPAPTLPSATGPGAACSIADRTSAGVTRRARMSFRAPSLVSPTSALTERTSSLPGWSSVQSMAPARPAATLSVLVRMMGVSMVPSSCTCSAPASLPNALPTKTAPATLSWNRLPPCGRMAVTPVLMASPSTIVTCPTRTPSTSVMALRGPGSKTPGRRPTSRARGRSAGCPDTGATASVESARQPVTRARKGPARRSMRQRLVTRPSACDRAWSSSSSGT